MKDRLISGLTLGLLALAGAAPDGAGSRPPAAAGPTTQPAKSKSADQMLDQMLRPSAPTDRPLKPVSDPVPDRTSGKNAVAPAAPVVNVMREGTFLVDRVGRLTKSADSSRAEFTFESDGKALRDPPVVIIPNLKLMAMEDAIAGNSRDPRFRISGMLTEYRGRNYIMLEKVVVVLDSTSQLTRPGADSTR